MTAMKRQVLLIGVMLAMMAAAGVWQVGEMLDARAAASVAAKDRQAAEQLADAIAALREQPAVAAEGAMEDELLMQRIEAAARASRFPLDALEEVFPQNAQRIGNAPYFRKPTALSFRAVRLDRLTEFLIQLTKGSSLTVETLRLRTPPSETEGRMWEAEATVTYLIYSPEADASANR